MIRFHDNQIKKRMIYLSTYSVLSEHAQLTILKGFAPLLALFYIIKLAGVGVGGGAFLLCMLNTSCLNFGAVHLKGTWI